MSTEVYVYLFITAVIFTIAGYHKGTSVVTDTARKRIIALTIENLIKGGYIATSGSGDNMSVIKIAEHDKTH